MGLLPCAVVRHRLPPPRQFRWRRCPSRDSAVRITFFGHFGSLNTGNESTLLAILLHLRTLHPDCEFSCICSSPETVVKSYGIEAVPISTRAVTIWNRQARLDRRLTSACMGLSQELFQYFRAFRVLGRTDTLIVPGTGLLTDAYGLSGWGPYSLFKWSLVARLRGCRVLFVSVGAGPIHSRLGRFLVKSALYLAAYRSYRDESSMDFLSGIGFNVGHDRVFPDLAFGLPETLLPYPRTSGQNRVVGIGLMTQDEKYSFANPHHETYEKYLHCLVLFATWLLANDYDIRIFVGDGDTFVIDDFKSLLDTSCTYDEGRVIDQPVTSVGEILAQIAATDVVVGTRFHNVLLALILNKPVIAISFHQKCISLMNYMNLSEYCHAIDHMNAAILISQFRNLQDASEKTRPLIRERVLEARRALEDQYELLFGAPHE